MKMLFLVLVFFSCWAKAAPDPFPVFLKAGFSTVLDFEEAPIKVVLGDAQQFQVERLEKSLVLRTLVPYGVGNMFVYFKTIEPKLFILNASEDAQPTFYQKFETIRPQAKPFRAKTVFREQAVLNFSRFDGKKDYLTVEIEISAGADRPVLPKWDLVRLSFNSKDITPLKLWSARKDIQRDSKVKSRFVFAKPNVPKNLKNVFLIVPRLDSQTPFRIGLVTK